MNGYKDLLGESININNSLNSLFMSAMSQFVKVKYNNPESIISAILFIDDTITKFEQFIEPSVILYHQGYPLSFQTLVSCVKQLMNQRNLLSDMLLNPKKYYNPNIPFDRDLFYKQLNTIEGVIQNANDNAQISAEKWRRYLADKPDLPYYIYPGVIPER